ncbi:site-specific integrase [Brenneria populi]|uniref:Site-specific integrase n=1 Tax=Brenneria populi TaxID=1505588 RepID=A0ABU6JWR1_9GAMM|nr:site-specific integrase [Brenneria populi Li et al. 2015]
MTVRKLNTGKWLCECYPNGRDSKRIRKQFNTKGEAESFEKYTMREVDDKPWLGAKEDRRKLSELIELWHNLHGRSLSAIESRMGKFRLICNGLNDPIASRLTAKDWAHYRDKRLAGEIPNGRDADPEKWIVKPITVNREQQYLCAMFNELKRLGEWHLPNPLDGIRVFKEAEKEMSWLTKKEIPELLAASVAYGNDDLTTIIKICLATGARWREAESLTRSQLSPCKVTFFKTKGKKNRSVPIPQWLYDELSPRQGRMFTPCYQTFKKVLARTHIELPEGQKTHVLRHTFASHFMMNGGNILVLQRILGHANIRETMRYAHFAPDHLEEAVHLNPLSDYNGGKMAAELS